MENKKKEKNLNFYEKSFLTIFSLFLIFYYLYGFLIGENSAGGGGYGGDFNTIWNNLILLNEDITRNLSSELYNDSRPPLSYIIHILFNPFIYEKEIFRISTFLISFFLPIFLFFSVRKNFKELNIFLAILLSLIVTLSPFFRTTSYWSLGENYGLIFLIFSYIFLNKLKKNFNEQKNEHLVLRIFLICLFSSLTIYFDQKLIFVPFIILTIIIFQNIDKKYKIFSLLLYILFSLPYFYLISIWGSIIPTSASIAREVGSFHPVQIFYCLISIAFYIFPFLICNQINLKDIRTEIIVNQKKIFLILILVLIFSFLNFNAFENLSYEGKGAFFKLSLILFNDSYVRYSVTVIAFLISALIVYFFFTEKKDLFIIGFLLLLSSVTFPFYQEYVDPLVLILLLTFFKTKININRKNIYFILVYFLIFLEASKYYYITIL